MAKSFHEMWADRAKRQAEFAQGERQNGGRAAIMIGSEKVLQKNLLKFKRQNAYHRANFVQPKRDAVLAVDAMVKNRPLKPPGK